MAVNVAWWNNHFSDQRQSIGLTEEEAEKVFLRAPIKDIGTRLSQLLADVAKSDPQRHSEILRLIKSKIEDSAG